MNCSANGCTKPAVYRTLVLCKVHYDRLRYQGDANARPRFTRGWSVADKLAHYRLIPADPNECYGWSGWTDSNGYANIHVGKRDGRDTRAHRWAHREEVGPIPDGFEVDHTCHNADLACPGGDGCIHRRCTNPRHLRAVSKFINMQSAQTNQRLLLQRRHPNADRTHCKWGHEFTPENTWRPPDGKSRFCRECLRRRARERAERLRAR